MARQERGSAPQIPKTHAGSALTFRRTSISARKSPSAISEVFFRIFAATTVPYQVALCTTPNSPSPAACIGYDRVAVLQITLQVMAWKLRGGL